jgi:hypothetical protein
MPGRSVSSGCLLRQVSSGSSRYCRNERRQNLVERAVILSRDGLLPNPLQKNQTELMIPSLHRARTFHSSMALEDSDRALIVETHFKELGRFRPLSAQPQRS